MVKSIVLQLALATVLTAQADWPVYGHDDGGMRYSTLKQINGGNVSRLQRAWTYHTNPPTNRLPYGRGSAGSTTAFETTPLVIGNVLYLSTPGNRVIALDSETGREIWKYDPQANAQGKIRYQAHRGV